MRLAMTPWSPSTHSLHNLRFQEAVRTVLLGSVRHRNLGTQRRSARRSVPTLPVELWLVVLGQLLRRDSQVA